MPPPASPVHDQQAEIADRFGDYTEETSDDEYVDETAELYDPAAEASGSEDEDEDEDEDEGSADVEALVLSVKPHRAAVIEAVVPVAVSQIEIALPPQETAFEPAASAPVVDVMVEPAPVTPLLSAPTRAPRPRAAPGSKAKAAFTLRLDAARHLKLRLACAVTGRSAQQLVTEALDQLLCSIPELDAMADRAPAKRASR
jgi:hypothetical protein